MIFQSLISLYDRLRDTQAVPPFGFSVEDIGFAITIDREGHLIGQPEDLRKKSKKGDNFDYFLSEVPFSNEANVRSSTGAEKRPYFMVDKADRIFGMSGTKKAEVHRFHFKKLIEEVCQDSDDVGVLAVTRFLDRWNPQDSVDLKDWKEMSGSHGKRIAFRLQGEPGFIHERPAVQRLWASHVAKESYPEGYNFVDGRRLPIQSQYAQFKFGSGASLVSFNKNAFESYGKGGGENAPIGVEAEFKAATALKYLLRHRRQRLWVGDTTTVFWTERESAVETFMGQVLNPMDTGADAVGVGKFLEAVRAGKMPSDIENERDYKFFILGLSPNKARLAVKYWHVSTVGDMFRRLQQHFLNLQIEQSFKSEEKEPPFPGIRDLIEETVRRDKKKSNKKSEFTKNKSKVSPFMVGAVMRSILTGGPYPQNLYQGVMGRIRAERDVNYLKASILKAVLQRNLNKEVPMTLDPQKKDTAYLLGRLFAVLEKAQLDALGHVNATIKDRFYGAASTTPATVFPRLLKLSQHHIEKADYGYISDRRIAEIMEDITAFPSHLALEEQGLFAIAYYQQKNALWRKKEPEDNKGEDQ